MNKTPESHDGHRCGRAPSAERVRAACIEAAIDAYQQAGISGLCHEGRFEVVISALQMLDLENLPYSGEIS